MANALFLIKVTCLGRSVAFLQHQIIPVSLTEDRKENRDRMDRALDQALYEAITNTATTYDMPRNKLTSEAMSSQIIP